MRSVTDLYLTCRRCPRALDSGPAALLYFFLVMHLVPSNALIALAIRISGPNLIRGARAGLAA